MLIANSVQYEVGASMRTNLTAFLKVSLRTVKPALSETTSIQRPLGHFYLYSEATSIQRPLGHFYLYSEATSIQRPLGHFYLYSEATSIQRPLGHIPIVVLQLHFNWNSGLSIGHEQCVCFLVYVYRVHYNNYRSTATYSTLGVGRMWYDVL